MAALARQQDALENVLDYSLEHMAIVGCKGFSEGFCAISTTCLTPEE